jgi:hypothetical protein
VDSHRRSAGNAPGWLGARGLQLSGIRQAIQKGNQVRDRV